jgi:N-acetylmuramoyl-L-alanine amidase
MGGVRSYFEATPPPGSWFAAQAARRNGNVVASAAKNDDGDNDGNSSNNPVSAAASKAVAQAMTGSKSGEVKVASVKADSERADANVRDLHRVTAGESLRSIARQYGVSITALKNANRSINSDTVHAGMVLAIPSG